MKTIKGFEGEEIAVSDFGEWVGKDYIDYKFEYKNNQKVIKELFKENQELKKQLKELEESSANAINKQVARGIELVNQQKEFIEWLEYQVKLQEELNDNHLATGFEEILSRYKEIIGGK